MNRQETLSQLTLFDIRPSRALGQNFLADDRVTAKIISLGGFTPNDLVIEIGAGIGSLTRELIKSAGRVICIEIDQNLLEALRSQIDPAADCRILHADVLKTNLAALAEGWPGPVKVAANLPYYITTPAIEKVLCELSGCSEIILMVQKEAADRILASPGSKQYGPLAVLVASHGGAGRELAVPAASFVPQPAVDSCLIRISDAGKLHIDDWKAYKSFLENCFAHRRKTLLNGLKTAGYSSDRLTATQSFLETRNLPQDIRAEMLTRQAFHDLFEATAR